MLIVQSAVACQRLLQDIAEVSAGRVNIADAAVEALYHTVRLQLPQLDQTMLGVMSLALLIEG